MAEIGSAFHVFSGWINEYEACLGTKHWNSERPIVQSICVCSSMPKVMKIEMGTERVGLGPQWAFVPLSPEFNLQRN
ncbi:hypothetical protein TNCV_1219181 [Trichonephila clavipes]|nr:hypothetical protein TNCV_1219181 [Trichonephila clavipes]